MIGSRCFCNGFDSSYASVLKSLLELNEYMLTRFQGNENRFLILKKNELQIRFTIILLNSNLKCLSMSVSGKVTFFTEDAGTALIHSQNSI